MYEEIMDDLLEHGIIHIDDVPIIDEVYHLLHEDDQELFAEDLAWVISSLMEDLIDLQGAEDDIIAIVEEAHRSIF